MHRLKKYIRKVTVFIILILLIIVACPSALFRVNKARADEDISPKRVVGYLPTWSYQAYKNIDFSALTHINIAFCNPDSSGEITSGIPDNDLNAIVEKAHANNIKVLAALGGGGYGEPYRELISTSAKIEILNSKIVSFCEKYDLDGIDLDIEITSSDIIWQNYGKWVTALRLICDERNWLLSTATAQWVAGSTAAATFDKFDYLNVMAYDNDSRSTNSHSSYEFAVECLNYFYSVKSVPKDRLVLGVPFYGRGYDASGQLDWNSYLSFADLIKSDTANYNCDFYGNIAYTGADTMRKKCDLSKEYGGIMIWEITLDADGEYSLLKVIKEEILTPVEAPEKDNSDVNPKAPVKNQDATLWIVIGSVSGLVVIAITVVTIIIAKRRKDKKNGLV